MKKAIIFTIIILSLVVTGCIKKTSPALENVGEQITKSASPTASPSEQTTEESELSAPSTIVVEGTEGWRVYEKPEMNVRLLYHKDWYYDRDEQAEKELGYDLYVGFAESPEILEKGAPYPIEFIITSGDQELHQYLEYSKVVYNTDDLDYILATSNKSKYQDILDKMAESFSSSAEATEDKDETAE